MPGNRAIHFLNGDRLLAPATKNALKLFDRSRGRNNSELPLPNVNELDSVSGFNTQLRAHLRRNGDLSF